MKNLEIQISGKIQNSNFPVWKDSLLQKVHSINITLITDEDFAVATEDAKLLKKAEKAIQDAKIRAIKQTEEIQLLFNALDQVSEQARQARLSLERQIKFRKQQIRDELITSSITQVQAYINRKPQIFSQLDNSKYLQRYQYELAIKGKYSIVIIRNVLNSLVQNLKNAIDQDSKQVLHNYAIIEAVAPQDRLLFQDFDYLVSLPEKELRLTIENRIVKFSEQAAKIKAISTEKALNNLNQRFLLDAVNENKNLYVISIELLTTRQNAIDQAREIKSLLEKSDCLVDMKLKMKGLQI